MRMWPAGTSSSRASTPTASRLWLSRSANSGTEPRRPTLSTAGGYPPQPGNDGGVGSRLASALRSTGGALREALGNEGIRRLELSWSVGIAADTALTIVLLVAVYDRGGVVATGLLGAIRM